ncbi:MAG: SIMPL domain-containing protein [Nitrososphaerales archaeon]|nr:SIMPL domain-containing protein [Nitrososphaerales archaeon]
MSNATGKGTQTLIAVGVIVLIALLATQTYALVVAGPWTGGSTSSRTVSVSGTGQVEIQPDRATLTIGVLTQATTAQTAVQENANTMSNVISALEGMGISNSSVQTTSYNIYPLTSYGNGTQKVTGYQVTNEVTVTVVASGQSLGQLGARAGQVIDTAASQGANEIYGIQFTASESALQQAQQTALKQAGQNASQQAHILASAMGVSITGVASATSSPTYTSPVYFAAVSALAAATPIVSPQSLTVTAMVQAVYSIG